MPRRSKGPRLYLRKGKPDGRGGRYPDVWVIRDGMVEIGTGCAHDQLAGPQGAESQLASYIGQKHAPRPPAETDADTPERRSDPSRVLIAEVLALYAAERAPRLADPGSAAGRMTALQDWWADRALSDIRRSSCEAYVAHRTAQPIRAFKADAPNRRNVSDQAARRELEDLSAAIGYWDDEHHLAKRPKVVLPEKPESPRDALSRAQAARLLMAARGYRLHPKGLLHPSGRPRWVRLRDSGPANRAHLKRFVLIGLYTGTRPGVIPRLLWAESPTQAWVDLDAATIYRRGKREKDHRTKRRPLVKIPPRLLAHLRRWARLDQAAMAARAQRNADELLDPPLATTNAVIHHGGRPIVGRPRRAYAAAVRDAGLPAEVTPHWQRHTAATWLMQNGCDLYEAAGYLGMTVKTLEDHYAHH
ncbi:MAG: tyrosine-type recombinase/integrase, partial [Phenylobacterium sp.]|nr:tyrosine-type recombinase/integrase [Phenylobacterium sp.]